MSVGARQLDAFAAPSRVGGCLEVARDEMIERVDRGEPVAWVAPGKAGTVVYAWVAYRDGGCWAVAGIGLAAKAHPWPQAEVTRAVAGALSVLDPDSAIVHRTLAQLRAATEMRSAFRGAARMVGSPLAPAPRVDPAQRLADVAAAPALYGPVEVAVPRCRRA